MVAIQWSTNNNLHIAVPTSLYSSPHCTYFPSASLFPIRLPLNQMGCLPVRYQRGLSWVVSLAGLVGCFRGALGCFFFPGWYIPAFQEAKLEAGHTHAQDTKECFYHLYSHCCLIPPLLFSFCSTHKPQQKWLQGSPLVLPQTSINVTTPSTKQNKVDLSREKRADGFAAEEITYSCREHAFLFTLHHLYWKHFKHSTAMREILNNYPLSKLYLWVENKNICIWETASLGSWNPRHLLLGITLLKNCFQTPRTQMHLKSTSCKTATAAAQAQPSSSSKNSECALTVYLQ